MRNLANHSRLPIYASALLSLLLCSFVEAWAKPAAGGESATMHWQSVPEAQVKVDDKTPLTWSVYQPDKKAKKNPIVLILLGHRYILVDTKEKLVYEIPLAEIHLQGGEMSTDEMPGDGRPIPTSDWTSRDVGPAQLIQVTLGDYGRRLTLALPHIPDIRLGIY